MDLSIVEALRTWRSRMENALMEDSLLGRSSYEDLLFQLDGYIDLLDDPSMKSPDLNNYKLSRVHPIESMGCGSVVIRMFESGLSSEEISQRLTQYTSRSISHEEVDDWLNAYQMEGASRRKDMTKSSIFDTSSRLEELFMELSQMVISIQAEDDRIFKDAKTTRYNVLLDYKKEMRQLAKDAADIVKALHEMASARELCRAVVEIVGQESPNARQRIYQRLEGVLQLVTLYE